MKRKPVALFLHGYGADRLSWTFNQPAIAEVADVLTPDLPGHGRSRRDHSDGSFEHLTAHVSKILDGIEDQPVYLVGHSLGGGIALALASRAPERIAGLFLVAPIGLGARIDHTFINEFTELEDPNQARDVLARLVANPSRLTAAMVEAVLAQLRRAGARAALRQVGERLIAEENLYSQAAARVADSGLRRTVVWGNADQINPVSQPRLDQFGGDISMIEGAGHMPHMEEPRLVTALMRDLIAG
jgi:pimeloyl-ACP methyl ester carboxylesterase